MIKLISFLFLSLTLLGSVQAEDKLSKEDKKHCDDLKKKIEALDKGKAALDKEIQALEDELAKANMRFEEHRAKLNGMRGCSTGNEGNTPECIQVLEGLSASGRDITSTKELIRVPAKKKSVIENDLLTPRAMQKELKCPVEGK